MEDSLCQIADSSFSGWGGGALHSNFPCSLSFSLPLDLYFVPLSFKLVLLILSSQEWASFLLGVGSRSRRGSLHGDFAMRYYVRYGTTITTYLARSLPTTVEKRAKEDTELIWNWIDSAWWAWGQWGPPVAHARTAAKAGNWGAAEGQLSVQYLKQHQRKTRLKIVRFGGGEAEET